MFNLKLFFTWWNRQTFGTLLKTLFFGKLVGKDDKGNRYYQSKDNDRWLIYSKSVEASKIPNEWYLWIHHTIDVIPKKDSKAFSWQKDRKENLTGTDKSYRPNTILDNEIKKKYETWKN